MRDRLSKSIKAGIDKHESTIENYVFPIWDFLADYLLADGWMRPPCKVGDVVYVVDKRSKLWWKGTIISVCNTQNCIECCVLFDDGEFATYSQDCIFANREDAEKALRGGDEE